MASGAGRAHTRPPPPPVWFRGAAAGRYGGRQLDPDGLSVVVVVRGVPLVYLQPGGGPGVVGVARVHLRVDRLGRGVQGEVRRRTRMRHTPVTAVRGPPRRDTPGRPVHHTGDRDGDRADLLF